MCGKRKKTDSNNKILCILEADLADKAFRKNREQYDIERLKRFLKANTDKEAETIKRNLLQELNWSNLNR